MHSKRHYITAFLLMCAVFNFFVGAPFAFAFTDAVNPTLDSQYLSISSGTSMNPGNVTTFSAEAWIKFTSVPTGNGDCVGIADKWGGSKSVDVYFFIWENTAAGSVNGILDFAANNGTTEPAASVAWNPTAGTWYHVKVTRNGTTVKFYVDTAVNTITQQGATQTLSNNIIFANNSGSFFTADNAHAGGNDKVGCNATNVAFKQSLTRVWSTDESARTDTCSALGATTGLLAEWSLDNVLTDDSGNGNTLTNNGSTPFSADVPPCPSSPASPSNFGSLIFFGWW